MLYVLLKKAVFNFKRPLTINIVNETKESVDTAIISLFVQLQNLLTKTKTNYEWD